VDSLEGFRRQLRVLADDPKVRGVLLHVEGLAISAAKRAAVTELLDGFRASGKQVAGFAVSPSTSEYELLCSTNPLFLPPAGRLELTGMAAELSTIGAGLKRVGIAADFVRRGEFKTAPEMFTRDTVSEVQRKSIEQFLDERYEALLKTVADARAMSAEDVRRKVDSGPYSARRALAEGLVDELCSEVDLPKRLELGSLPAASADASDDDEHDSAVGPFSQYAATRLWPPVRWRAGGRKPRIAVVPLRGMIVPGDGAAFPGGPALAGADSIIRALRGAARDRRASAVLLFIDSPGGSALASELILDEVKRAAAKKTMVSYFDRVAASGGFMAALGGKEIWAAPHAVAGSIGVFAGKFDSSELLSKIGIDRVVLTRGENAAMLSFARGFTDHERKALEADVEEMYQSFLEHVAAARSRTRDEIHALAEGRVYSGMRAKSAGLVDGTCSFDAACRRAFELAEAPLTPEADYEVAIYAATPRRFPLLDFVRSLARWHVYALWAPWVRLPE
jgi:protease-4